jgi:hypothetical protein
MYYVPKQGYWNIQDADGNTVNRINGSEEFVAQNYDHYEWVEIPVDPEPFARSWRDEELVKTDEFAKLPDYPHHAILLEYRQALRDWPSTVDFPDTVPESLESRIENAP